MAEIRRLCADWPGLSVAGCAYEGVGIPDCIRQGKDAADDVCSENPVNP
jgi:oxygen-dependent protoporphyrinogen oxidase